MLRTIFTIGLFAVLGLIVLNVVFSVLPALISIFMWLLWKALLILAIGLLIYFVIRLLSPDTARKLRERWSGY